MADRIWTLEADRPDDDIWVGGVRHAECAGRTDQSFCIVVDAPVDRADLEDRECWGCAGWLDEPPLTPEETAAKTRIDD